MINALNYTKKTVLTIGILAALSACQPASQTQNNAADSKNSETTHLEGPKASLQRTVAKPAVQNSQDGQSTVIEVDFGNVSDGSFHAPARGLIITPKHADEKTELIVISHLRAPNCTDKSFAYPCPDQVDEFRYDRGMRYLGEHLAAQGYTVIIPDLGGIFIGADVEEPYNQQVMWQKLLNQFIDIIKSGQAEQMNKLGAKIAQVDFSKVGLLVHSRSAMLEQAAQDIFGKTNLRSIFAYGPAYDTVELEHISDAPIDVPYLALVGSMDVDVGSSANLWLGHYATEQRTTPALSLELPGFGHMYINQAASAAKFDDRIGCDVLECPDAKAHENIIKNLTNDWFNATLKQAKSTLPITADMPLSEQVLGLPARWLGLTPNALAFVDAKAFVNNQSDAKICVHPDPTNPKQPDNACPESENGFVQILTPVAHLSRATADVNIKGIHGLSLQLSPSDSFDDVDGTAITITLHRKDAEPYQIKVAPTHPAVINRQSANDNGIYRLSTVRLPLTQISDDTINAISIESQKPIYLRSVDFW